MPSPSDLGRGGGEGAQQGHASVASETVKTTSPPTLHLSQISGSHRNKMRGQHKGQRQSGVHREQLLFVPSWASLVLIIPRV